MANWAYTCYIAAGDASQLKRLHDTMAELEAMKSPGLCDNDFGSAWLGNLVTRLGSDWKEVYCRGHWDGLQLEEDGTLHFGVESAWDELAEVRHLIEEKCPGIKLFYQCEEPGMCIYTTNDTNGNYFPERYYLWIEDEEPIYHSDLEALIDDIESITGTHGLTTFSSCEEALEEYATTRPDLDYTLEQFTIHPD